MKLSEARLGPDFGPENGLITLSLSFSLLPLARLGVRLGPEPHLPEGQGPRPDVRSSKESHQNPDEL